MAAGCHHGRRGTVVDVSMVIRRRVGPGLARQPVPGLGLAHAVPGIGMRSAWNESARPHVTNDRPNRRHTQGRNLIRPANLDALLLEDGPSTKASQYPAHLTVRDTSTTATPRSPMRRRAGP